MNRLKQLWPYVQFYWNADDRWLGFSIIMLCLLFPLALLPLLVELGTIFPLAMLLQFTFIPFLFIPLQADADCHWVLPCAEFMLSRPVSRCRLYYTRLLLVGLLLFPTLMDGAVAVVWQPDSRAIKVTHTQTYPNSTVTIGQNPVNPKLTTTTNREVTVTFPRGEWYNYGLTVSAGVLILLLFQGVLLLPLSGKVWRTAPTVWWVIWMASMQLPIYAKGFSARNYYCALFFFADWWWLLIPTLAVTAALVQWLVCWRLKNLQIR